MRLFMPITKTEELSDGSLLVSGIASTESVDSDGETISAEAMKAAMPDFFKYGTGNLREMHQLSAAGTVDKADIADGVTYIETTVVDPVAVKKVKAGVYKGFSIGGRATKRDDVNKKLITGVRLSEISLVDRPANPDSVIQMYKAEGLEESDVKTNEPAADATELEKAAISAIADLLNKGTVKAGDLLKAAQLIINPPPPVDPTPVAKAAKLEGDALKKGMGGLGQFACLLRDVAWMAQDAEWEAQIEGDGSALPAQLREWLSAGAAIFAAMTAEELAELVASVKPPDTAPAPTIMAAAPAGDVQKAAEPAPAASADPSQPANPATPAGEQAAATPSVADQSSVEKVESVPADDPIAKADELNKKLQDDLSKALEAFTGLKDELTKATARITQLEAQPMPGKALLKAIAKGADVATGDGSSVENEVPPVRKTDGTVDEAASLIKSIHATRAIPIGFR